VREGVVRRSAAQGWWDMPARKAPRLLMVRGMPLKEMHFRPVSRISSAVVRGVREGEREGAREWRARSEAGELRVNVAAACLVYGLVANGCSVLGGAGYGGRTESVTHGRSPYLRSRASFAMRV
jgi:hypothetical protein